MPSASMRRETKFSDDSRYWTMNSCGEYVPLSCHWTSALNPASVKIVGDDLDDRLVLEDAAILAVRERGERRDEVHPEVESFATRLGEFGRVHHAVERPRAEVLVDERQEQRLPQQSVRLEARVAGEELDRHLEGARQGLERLVPRDLSVARHGAALEAELCVRRAQDSPG